MRCLPGIPFGTKRTEPREVSLCCASFLHACKREVSPKNSSSSLRCHDRRSVMLCFKLVGWTLRGLHQAEKRVGMPLQDTLAKGGVETPRISQVLWY